MPVRKYLSQEDIPLSLWRAALWISAGSRNGTAAKKDTKHTQNKQKCFYGNISTPPAASVKQTKV